MTKAEEHIMDWLRDAHAMEKQAETMLASMAGRIENYPELKQAVELHLEETKEQAQRLSECIERRGGNTSTLKDAAGQFVAMGQGLSGVFVEDEVVKGTMAGYTFEQMEIAAYRTLIAAAKELGDTQTAAVCGAILEQEEATAKKLADMIPTITARYLERSEMGVTAKH